MQGLKPQELKQLILSVGTHRSDRQLSPMEVSDLIARAIEAGVSRSECASELRIGSTQLSAFLRLQNLTPAVRHLAAWGAQPGGIPFSSLALVAQLEGERNQQLAADAILEHDLTWSETVQLVQIARRSDSGVREALRRVLALRPEIETRHVIIGSVQSDQLRQRLLTMSQRERDSLLMRAASEAGLPSDLAGRLGPSMFTLVASRQVSSEIADADVVEATLNKRLRRLLDL